MMPRVIAHNGGDALIGLRLYQFFLDLGIPEPGLAVAQNVDASGEGKTLPLLTLRSVADSIVAAGLASAAEVAAAVDGGRGGAAMYVSLETLQRAVGLVDSLAELDDPASFAGIVLPGLATLVGCDVLTYNEIGPAHSGKAT